MALFSSTPKNGSKAQTPKVDDGRLAHTLKRPWFSEKAFIGTENGVYVFEVPASATKPEIKAAVEKFYSVTPRQIRVVNLPAKKVSLRTRRGTGSRARRHKAYVYLKKGDTISIA
ncbi:MAG TPA: 50S ribosomal protein L23 [Candidatus Paceibacterota bacterium]|jgi:large subunit ribosomal protein L23